MIHNIKYLFLLTRSYCDLCSFAPVVKVSVTVTANRRFIIQNYTIIERKALNLQNKYKPLPLGDYLPVVLVLCKMMVVFQRLGSTSSFCEASVSPATSSHYKPKLPSTDLFFYLCNHQKTKLPCCVWGLWLLHVIKKLYLNIKKLPNPNGTRCGCGSEDGGN